MLLNATSIGLAIVVCASKTLKGGLRPEADRARPHLLSETVSLALNVYGKLSSGDGSLFAHLKFEYMRTPRRLMTKLSQDADVEIRSSEGHLKLTEAGLAKLTLAMSAAPSLWKSLQ